MVFQSEKLTDKDLSRRKLRHLFTKSCNHKLLSCVKHDQAKKYDNKDFENNKKKFSACSRSCGLARMFAWRGIEEGKGPFTLLQSAFVWFSNLVSANWIWSANINCSFLIVKGRPFKKIEGKYRETREKVNELRKKHDDVKQKTADMHHESREFANYIETRREKRWVSKIIQAPHLW